MSRFDDRQTPRPALGRAQDAHDVQCSSRFCPQRRQYGVRMDTAPFIGESQAREVKPAEDHRSCCQSRRQAGFGQLSFISAPGTRQAFGQRVAISRSLFTFRCHSRRRRVIEGRGMHAVAPKMAATPVLSRASRRLKMVCPPLRSSCSSICFMRAVSTGEGAIVARKDETCVGFRHGRDLIISPGRITPNINKMKRSADRFDHREMGPAKAGYSKMKVSPRFDVDGRAQAETKVVVGSCGCAHQHIFRVSVHRR